MSGAANALRGEAELRIAGAVHKLRPSFAALVAAEAVMGPLFAVAERGAEGRMTLDEIATLFWHCIDERPPALTQAAVGEALAAAGLVKVTPVLRALLMQILQGR